MMHRDDVHILIRTEVDDGLIMSMPAGIIRTMGLRKSMHGVELTL